MDQFDSEKAQGEPNNGGLTRDVLAKRFGDSLRESREAAGFTIERVAIATKISLPFIQALELGELHRLPGSVFARGFIRNLCKVYQKDAASSLEAFERALGQADPVPAAVSEPEAVHQAAAAAVKEEVVPVATAKTVEAAPAEVASTPLQETLQTQLKMWREKVAVYLPLLRSQRNQLIAGAAVGVVLVSVLMFFVNDPSAESTKSAQVQPSQMPVVVEEQPPAPQGVPEENIAESQTEPAAVASASSENVPPAASAPVQAVKPAEPVDAAIPAPKIEVAQEVKAKPPVEEKAVMAQKKPETPKVAAVQRPERTPVVSKSEPARPAPAGVRQTLEIFARERVVVRLVKDGGAPQNITLEPKQHAFEFRDEAQVLIFDASVVDVKYNGRSLGPLGKRGRVRRLSFKREEQAVHAKM